VGDGEPFSLARQNLVGVPLVGVEEEQLVEEGLQVQGLVVPHPASHPEHSPVSFLVPVFVDVEYGGDEPSVFVGIVNVFDVRSIISGVARHHRPGPGADGLVQLEHGHQPVQPVAKDLDAGAPPVVRSQPGDLVASLGQVVVAQPALLRDGHPRLEQVAALVHLPHLLVYLLSIIKLQVVCEAANAVLVQGSADVAGQKQLGIGELSLHLRHFHIVLTPNPT